MIPPPGIYRDTPMAEYHGWDAASNSRLSKLLRSPAHLKAAIEEGFEETPALAFGRACHTAILEPEEFPRRYEKAAQCCAVTVKGARCSKTGVVIEAGEGGQLCSIHAKGAGVEAIEVLSVADWNRCLGMRDAVHRLQSADTMLADLGEVEVSIRWDDEASGVPCKARWDGYTKLAGGCILDLKTTVDAAPRAFEKSIFAYGYHRQGALYLRSAKAHDIAARHYVIIAVEKEPPFGACVYRLTEGAIEAGDLQLDPLLRRYAECMERDEWPCYPSQVQDIGLPDWAWKVCKEQTEMLV